MGRRGEERRDVSIGPAEQDQYKSADFRNAAVRGCNKRYLSSGMQQIIMRVAYRKYITPIAESTFRLELEMKLKVPSGSGIQLYSTGIRSTCVEAYFGKSCFCRRVQRLRKLMEYTREPLYTLQAPSLCLFSSPLASKFS